MRLPITVSKRGRSLVPATYGPALAIDVIQAGSGEKLSTILEPRVDPSTAEGSKAMGFLLGYALLSPFGRAQDRLSHVLVSKPFESHPKFCFPPQIIRQQA
jgi:CRISPR-associated protein (TIGR02584 family)